MWKKIDAKDYFDNLFNESQKELEELQKELAKYEENIDESIIEDNLEELNINKNKLSTELYLDLEKVNIELENLYNILYDNKDLEENERKDLLEEFESKKIKYNQIKVILLHIENYKLNTNNITDRIFNIFKNNTVRNSYYYKKLLEIIIDEVLIEIKKEDIFKLTDYEIELILKKSNDLKYLEKVLNTRWNDLDEKTIKKILKRDDCFESILKKCIYKKELIKSVVNHKNTTNEILMEVLLNIDSYENQYNIKESILKNNNCPNELINKVIYEDNVNDLLKSIFYNKSISKNDYKAAITKLIEKDSYLNNDICEIIIKHPCCSYNILEWLIEFQNHRINYKIQEKSNIPEHLKKRIK